MKLKKGDKVQVITGKDKGKEGLVERVYSARDMIMVPQVNVVKKTVKRSEQMPQGGIVEVERPLHAAKVMLVCPKCEKKVRVGFSVTAEKKVRICKSCKSEI